MSRVRLALASACLAACSTTSGSGSTGGAGGAGGGSGQPPPIETAVVLVSGLNGPGALAVRDGVLYWVDADGTIQKAPTLGGTPAVVGNGCKSVALAVDATRAYCAGTDQSVRAVDLVSGAATVLAASEPALDVAVDATRVYFSTYFGERVAGGNAISVIGAVPLDGGPVAALATKQLLPSSVAPAGGYLYWLDTAQDDDGTHPASGVAVWRAPLDGGAAASLGSTSGNSHGQSGDNPAIAVDGTSVYFTNEAALLSMPLAGGAPVTLATGFSGPLAVDAASVYWASDDANGAIMRTPLSGGASTNLVGGEKAACVAVDATTVYWSNPLKGTIASAPK